MTGKTNFNFYSHYVLGFSRNDTKGRAGSSRTELMFVVILSTCSLHIPPAINPGCQRKTCAHIIILGDIKHRTLARFTNLRSSSDILVSYYERCLPQAPRVDLSLKSRSHETIHLLILWCQSSFFRERYFTGRSAKHNSRRSQGADLRIQIFKNFQKFYGREGGFSVLFLSFDAKIQLLKIYPYLLPFIILLQVFRRTTSYLNMMDGKSAMNLMVLTIRFVENYKILSDLASLRTTNSDCY